MRSALIISIASICIVNIGLGEEYYFSGSGDLVLDFPAPIAVSIDYGCGYTSLGWEAPDGAAPDGYNVYRKTAPNGPWSLRNSNLIIVTSFNDNDIVLGTEFRYAVTAVYGGNESVRVECEPQFLPDPLIVDYILIGADSTEWLNYWYKSILDSFGLNGEIVGDIYPYCGDDLAGLPLLWLVSCPDGGFDMPYEKENTIIGYLENGGNLFVNDGWTVCTDSLAIYYLLYGYTTCIPYLFGEVFGVAGTFTEGLHYYLDVQLWSSNLAPTGNLPEVGVLLEDNVQCGCVDMYVDRQGFKAVINSQPIHEFVDGPYGTRHEYFLRMMDFFGIQVDIEREDDIELPEKTFILQAYPNPFNARITLDIVSSPDVEDITITIFDITGRVIKSFESVSSNMPVVWDARNINGRSVSSGVYFVKADRPNGLSTSVKLTLMK